MVFQFPNYGEIHFDDISQVYVLLIRCRYDFTPILDDHLILYKSNACLTYRVNASVTEIPEIKNHPANASKWDDFSPIYDDFEIGLMNPVDKKVISV